MARVVELERKRTDRPSTGLARIDDVKLDELRKKYLEQDSKNLPRDERTVEEIQADEDTKAASEFFEFFGLDEDFNVDEGTDPLDVMGSVSDYIENESKEDFQSAEAQREENINDDAKEQIEQVDVSGFTVNKDDPFLIEDYKLKSERLIKKVLASEEEETRGSPESGTRGYESSYADSKRDSSYTSRSSYESSSHRSSGGFRTADATASTVVDLEEKDKQKQAQYAEANEKIIGFAAAGPKLPPKKKSNTVYQFGAKKRLSWKRIKHSVRSWFKSERGTRVTKVGLMITMQTVLAIITKKYSFDGPTSLATFLGMNIGLFFVSAEINELGYDPRRLSFI